MKKVPTDIEAFAAKIADKQDNPTIHELAKAFPEKTYRELERYRDEDRQQEANQTPMTEAQQNLVEHIEAGTCIMGEMRKDREEPAWYPDGIPFKEKYEKEHKLRQEAEGELSIMKGIETNRVKEAQDALANALEVNESHRKLNGKLQERVTDLEEENRKMHRHLDKQVERARKSGL